MKDGPIAPVAVPLTTMATLIKGPGDEQALPTSTVTSRLLLAHDPFPGVPLLVADATGIGEPTDAPGDGVFLGGGGAGPGPHATQSASRSVIPMSRCSRIKPSQNTRSGALPQKRFAFLKIRLFREL